jgi:hypothetical protein
MSNKRHHAEWLSLVEVSGPFLTMPVIEKVFPQGLDAHDPEHYRNLRLAFEEWEDNQQSRRPNPAIHHAWIQFVLKETLGLPDEVLAEGQAIPPTLKASIAEHGETLRPDFIVRNPEDGADAGKTRLLIQVYPLDQNLEKPIHGRHWKATPATRMMELLHNTEVRVGLVTNGEHWMLVDAPRGDTTGFASWFASLWLEEKLTLQAFRSLLGVHRFFSVSDDETLEAMFVESAKHQQEVTDQLGYQVRRAVEVLVQSLDRADQDEARSLLKDVPETALYEAALTVMMRLVFLFCAEERELLLLGDPLYDQHYAVSTLVAQLQEAADQHTEEVLERRNDAWVRLLATFRAVYGGVQHERMKLPPYAGNLFNPDRFPFLEGRRARTSWLDTQANPLPVNNRTVLHLLRSLQYLELQGEARRLSFRALDIEQIGHVYEGLLDHTAKRATEPVLGLIGPKGDEPEISLPELERRKAKGDDELIKFLKEETQKSEKTLQKALEPTLETEGINRLRAACGNDEALFKRVRPFAGFVRNDSFDRPMVIRRGSVYVTAGTDRRSSGTHYTPRSLTEPIVHYTLEPLVYIGPAEGNPKEEWQLRSPRELLDLKICDMACGSGAFLVQACRYLSELLVEAWGRAEAAHKDTPGITPEGEAATGAAGEVLIPKDEAERLVYAQRLIAQRCLYGVDKNPLAAEMAKLSLWLLTLAKDKPFTFLDHAIRSGDSLVGITNLDQLRYFTLDLSNKQQSYFTTPVLKLVDEAVTLRKKISERAINSVEDVQAEEQLLKEVEEKTARLRYAADLLIAVEFQGANAREKEDLQNDAAIQAAYNVEKSELEEFRAAAHKALNGQTTFHWALEFPEVMLSKGGFDAFIGNPPFMGGKKITGNLGTPFRNYLINVIAANVRGNSDLCSYFLLQASALLTREGQFGLLATNTIAQGETREVGLDQLIERGYVITRAISSRKWPGTANLEVAYIWVRHGLWSGSFYLEDLPVDGISSSLTISKASVEVPKPLIANTGKAFMGSNLRGIGFVLSPEEASSLLTKNTKNKNTIFPYLSGEDITTRPNQSPSRWVINFFDWEKEEAMSYPEVFSIVESKVLPERMRIKHEGTRKKGTEFFWRFDSQAKELYSTIAEMKRVLVCPIVAKYVTFVFQPTNIIYMHKVYVFAYDSYPIFAVLNSNLHEPWAREYSSTLETRLNYSSSDCFVTFPIPENPNELEGIGERYYTHRQSIMLSRQEGLTKTYNHFHSVEETASDIHCLRELHIEMDNAVADAYGWADLDLQHGFHSTKQGVRFTITEAARREVLDRLLQLNHERYAEEVRQGLHDKKAKGKVSAAKATGKRQKAKGKSSASTSHLPLFGDGDDEGEPAGVTSRKQTTTSKQQPNTSKAKANSAKPAVSRAIVYTTPSAPAAPRLADLDTNEVMAAFRKASRNRGWMGRDEIIKEVSAVLGYQRLSANVEVALRNHLRAAIRRKIVETQGYDSIVRAATQTMSDYTLEELREVFRSVMRKGSVYEREEVIYAIARYLGFARVTDTIRQPIKSAINSAIRQGILGYAGEIIWREG